MGLIDKILGNESNEQDGRKKPPQEQQNQITLNQKNVQNADKRLLHEKEMARAKQKESERKIQGEKEAPDKKDVSKHLQKQQKKLSRQNLKHNIGFSKIIDFINEYEVYLTSRTTSTKFALWTDIVTDDKGTIYLVGEKLNEVEPNEFEPTGEEDIVIGGPNLGRIFANPQGLGNEVKSGMVRINKNDDGGYVMGPETVDVPQMIWVDEEKKWIQTEEHTEKYMKQVAQLRQQVNQLRNENAWREKALMDISESKAELERIIESQEVVNESLDKQLEKWMDEWKQTAYDMDDMQSQFRRMSMINQTNEDIAHDLVVNKEKVFDKLSDEIDTDEFEEAQDTLRDAIELIMDNKDELIDLRQAEEMMKQAQAQGGQPPPQSQGQGPEQAQPPEGNQPPGGG